MLARWVLWGTGQECVPQTLHSRDEESQAACNRAPSRSQAVFVMVVGYENRGGRVISEAGSDDLALITSNGGYWRNRTAFPGKVWALRKTP